WHDYSLLMGPHPKDFIDYLCLDTYYKSNTDSISGTKIYSTFCPWYGQKVSFQLNQNLIKQGFEFFYNVTAKDKGLIPKYRTRPITGYYKLIYDPSPAQVLFSNDSIFIPTLIDSGSVKIVNTSDHSIRIDSIISVGSFYGYWGSFSKPGFEYPFYLFQTMPGFLGDTLGIIIPPHDSIIVSFFNVDLCPFCDYEVQDYFKDTLRFVFTFMDGNVYSFSKSIPISGEGHPSDVEDEEILPKEFSLSQNYPNPFNPSTKISWQSPVGSWQTLKIFDLLGNEVITLVNEYRNAGSYEVDFYAHKLSSGVYYCQSRAGNFVETKKMILLR
ncbi:MAG TPA: T9SS type A sorting domain-containing protein, partial [Ignavibacteriaceae bacterium]